jgi:hypothetical protein
MPASLSITDDRIFMQAASIESQKLIKSKLSTIQANTTKAASAIILASLNNSDTVQSLLFGSLRDDFGLFGNSVQITVNNIVKYISQNIKIKIEQYKSGGFIFRITVQLLSSNDLQNIIEVPLGSFPSRGGMVNWLEWLTTKGSQVVIGDYWIFPYAKGKTRSGGTKIMKKITSSNGEPFRVDPKYAGNADSNFITRAIEDVADEILNIVALEVEKVVK